MRWLETLSVLSVTLSIVWSMAVETTSSRYLEADRDFNLSLGDIRISAIVDIKNSSFDSHNNVTDSSNSNAFQGYVNSVNTSLVLSSTSVALPSNVLYSSRRNASKEPAPSVGEGRKIKTTNKMPTRKHDSVLNSIKPTIKDMKQNITRRRVSTNSHKLKATTTPKTKFKLTTLAPIKIKLTKPTMTTKKPKVSTPKSYSTTRRPKPTIKKTATKPKDSATSTPDLKQNWYEDGVPYPNPMPEITSSSPPFSISDVGSQISSSTTENILLPENLNPQIFTNTPSEPLQGVPPILPAESSAEDLESVAVSAADPSNSNPISTFNLDMLPTADLTRDPAGSGCPTVHISSSVLSPLQRQGCSDLNLVLNTHYHQNQDTRNPGVSTYDAQADPDPVEEDIIEADPVVDDGLANAGPTGGGAADSVPASYIGGGSPPGGGTGGSGGSGGSGGDGGGNDGFRLPDLKPMFEALGYLMRGLWWLFQKLLNPWLYIVPIVLFFKLGFLGILTLFPWWIPFVFLYFSVRSDEPKNTVDHVKHYHKPVVVKHPDGWYWDQATKTWKDVLHPHRNRRSAGAGGEDLIDDRIIRLGAKYLDYGHRAKKRFKKRSTPQPTNTNNTVGNVSVDTNISSMAVFDVRTPPKIQSMIKEKISSKYSMESSHAGVAIPIEDDLEVLEESTKKMNFYKLERPTTSSNGGLSTWILLSGQTSTSPKPTTKRPSVKPLIMKDDKKNETLLLSDKPIKMVKPVFKQRSTTPKSVPTSSSSTKTTTVRVNTISPPSKVTTTRKPTKLTKIKASLLQSIANSKLNNSTITTTAATNGSTTLMEMATTEPTNVTTTTLVSSASMPAEAKEGDQELPATDEKKKKTQKRKKNKNKRRKPEKTTKEGNNKLKEIESPGTQLYSYLRSEIIPVTVGVSLVGLLVTAGLASYYLQPFAALRRSSPIDRKDSGGHYYYQDEYSNSMPEEEAIGKVIAGMPESTLQGISGNTYKPPTSRNTYPQNIRYRHVDRRSQIYMNPYGLVEDVKLADPGSGDKKFVVGNAPKEVVPEVTPAVVPEHGPRNLKVDEQKFVVGNVPKEFFSSGASPRNLKLRRRRQVPVPDDIENEISPEGNEIDSGTSYKETTTKMDTTTAVTEAITTTTEVVAKETTPHNVYKPNERPHSLFELIAELVKLKIKLGLELVENAARSVSTYVSSVQKRLNEHDKMMIRGNATKRPS